MMITIIVEYPVWRLDPTGEGHRVNNDKSSLKRPRKALVDLGPKLTYPTENPGSASGT